MKKTILSICIMLAAVSTAKAQEFTTSYFLDNNLYSYRINPAIPGEKGFVGFAISNVNFSFGSNTGINAFLYPRNGKLVTVLHKDVSSDDFLKNMPKTLRMDQVFNENLLAIGFWTKKSFHNIELNVKEDIFAGLPRDMFEMFKCGSGAYDISNTRLSVKSYVEVAYGYQRKINDKFSVGGRLKFLVGLAAGDVFFNRGGLTVNGNQVSYDLDARVRLSTTLLNLKMGVKDNTDIFDFSSLSMDIGDIKPCGLGGAVDLGMTYKPIKDLTLSFSVIDLGGISWNYNIVGKSSGSDSFTGETITSDGTLKGDLKQFTDNLQKLAEFRKVEGEGEDKAFNMLACTLHLGARYFMPFYDRLSVGLLASYRIDKYNPCLGAKVGATVTPVDWLSLTGNYGINSYGNNFGLALSLNALNFNFVLGYEGYSGKISRVNVADILSIGTPLGPFQNMVKLGINITFGKRHNSFKSLSDSFIHGKKAAE